MKKGFLLLLFVGLAPALSAIQPVVDGGDSNISTPKDFMHAASGNPEKQVGGQPGNIPTRQSVGNAGQYVRRVPRSVQNYQEANPKKSYTALAIVSLYLLNEAYLVGKKMLTDDEESRTISELRAAWRKCWTADAKRYIAEQWDAGNKWLVVSTGIEILGPASVASVFIYFCISGGVRGVRGYVKGISNTMSSK